MQPGRSTRPAESPARAPLQRVHAYSLRAPPAQDTGATSSGLPAKPTQRPSPFSPLREVYVPRPHGSPNLCHVPVPMRMVRDGVSGPNVRSGCQPLLRPPRAAGGEAARAAQVGIEQVAPGVANMLMPETTMDRHTPGQHASSEASSM